MNPPNIAAQDQTRKLLRELGIRANHLGYHYLCVAVPLFAENGTQSITKELYPQLCRHFNQPRNYSIERVIRAAVEAGWQGGYPEAWRHYFPTCSTRPSNAVFIATLAEWLK